MITGSVLIVADKYLIQIHHLAELAFTFLKHQKFPKSNERARRYLISRTLAFFMIKKATRTRHVITPLIIKGIGGLVDYPPLVAQIL